MVRRVRTGCFRQSEVSHRAMSVVYDELGEGGEGLGLQDLTGVGSSRRWGIRRQAWDEKNLFESIGMNYDDDGLKVRSSSKVCAYRCRYGTALRCDCWQWARVGQQESKS
jgi:hypothetical protein